MLIPKDLYKTISPEYHIKTEHRTNELIDSYIAIQQLMKIDFVLYYSSYYGISVQFRGIYKYILLPSDYFIDIDYLQYSFTKDGVIPRSHEIYHDVNNLLNEYLLRVKEILTNLRRDELLYFTKFGFFLFLYKEMFCGQYIAESSYEALFKISIDENEVGCLFNRGAFLLETISNIKVLITPTLQTEYWLNEIQLKREKSFKVINSLVNKEVIWIFDSRFSSANLDTLIELFPLLCYFHREQSLQWPHVFRFKDANAIHSQQLYEIYRTWSEYIRMLRGSLSSIRRYSSSLIGFTNDKLIPWYNLVGTGPPPVIFDFDKDSNINSLNALINKYYQSFKKKECHFHLHCGYMRVVTLVDEGRASFYKYTPIYWDGLKIITNSISNEGQVVNKLDYVPLPNPYVKLESISSIQNAGLVKKYKEVDYFINPYLLFRSCIVKCALGRMSSNSNISLQSYRNIECFAFRQSTKDAYSNHNLVNETFDFRKAYPFILNRSNIQAIVKQIIDKKGAEKIKWNKSTLKLLSVFNQLERDGIITIGSTYTMQMVGVINEPLITLFKYAPNITISKSFGSSAIFPNLRTSIEQSIQTHSHDIIFSDVDQSWCTNEIEVAETAIKHIITLYKNCTKFLIFKLQYGLPRILSLIEEGLIKLKFLCGDVYFLKSLYSGVYSSELFLVLIKDDSKLFVGFEKINSLCEAFEIYQMPFQLKQQPLELNITSIESLKHLSTQSRHSILYSVVSSQAELKIYVSALLHVCNSVISQPIAKGRNDRIVLYGERNLDRCKLTERIDDFGTVEQVGDVIDANKGISNSDAQFPLYLPTGVALEPPIYYNLICRDKISQLVKQFKCKNSLASVNVLDIGGRNFSQISSLDVCDKYTIMDDIMLPSYIDGFGVTLLNRKCLWEKDVFDYSPYNVIICMFTMMFDSPDVETVQKRMEFLQGIYKGRSPCLIITNYYFDTNKDFIPLVLGSRYITYGANDTGSFAGYTPVPLFSITKLPINFVSVPILRNDVIKTQCKRGLSISPELFWFINYYCDFCPIIMSEV